MAKTGMMEAGAVVVGEGMVAEDIEAAEEAIGAEGEDDGNSNNPVQRGVQDISSHGRHVMYS